jgi:hypothetical protein
MIEAILDHLGETAGYGDQFMAGDPGSPEGELGSMDPELVRQKSEAGLIRLSLQRGRIDPDFEGIALKPLYLVLLRTGTKQDFEEAAPTAFLQARQEGGREGLAPISWDLPFHLLHYA